MISATTRHSESITPASHVIGSSHTADGSRECHWLTKPEDFLPWVDAWCDLLRRSPAPVTAFHEPAWILGCWRCPRNRMAVGLIAEGSRLRAGIVCHVEIDVGHAVLMPVQLLSFTPHIAAALSANLVVVADDDPPAEVNILLDHAVRQFHWRVLFLNYLDSSNAWFETAVRATAAARGWRVREGNSSTDAFVDTAGGIEGYHTRRGTSSKTRHNQRRHRTHLEAEGALAAVEIARTDVPDEIIFAELVDIFER